jgi:hypothetical protein
LDSWKHSRSRSLFVALRRRQRTGVRHDTTDAHRSSGNRHSLTYPIQRSIRMTINASFSIIILGKISSAISATFSFVMPMPRRGQGRRHARRSFPAS